MGISGVLAKLSQKDGGLLVSVLGGVRWSLLFRVSSAGFAFLIAVLTARILGLEGYGQLQYVLGVLNVVLVFGSLGLAKVVIRETAWGANENAWGPARGIMRFASPAMIGATLVLAAGAAAFFIWPVAPDSLWLFALGLVAILARQVAIPATSFMNGLRKIGYAGLSEFVRDLLIVVTLAVVWFAMAQGAFATEQVMAVRVGAALLSTAGLLWLYRRVARGLEGAWQSTEPTYKIADWLKAGFPLMIVMATSVIFSNADIMMIGIFLGSEEVGLYHAASRVAHLVGQCIGILIMPLSPVIASLSQAGDFQKLRGLIRRVTLIALGFGMPLAALLMLLAGPVLQVFGPEFTAGDTALRILVAGQLVNVATGPVQALLVMSGYERYAAYASVTAALLNIALNYVLIPIWGINGAAFATAVAVAVSNLMLFCFVRRHVWPKDAKDGP